jgi:hypothetical protein
MRSIKVRAFHAGIASLLILAALPAACGSAAIPLLPPDQIVAQSAQSMGRLAGFHFLIERTGAPAFLPGVESVSLRRVEGDFIAPDKARAAVRLIAPGVILDVQAISTEGHYWETNPVSGAWQAYPAEQGFNPAVLFAPQSGIPEILRSDLTRLTLNGVVELEDLPGLKLYEIEGQLDGRRIFELSYGLIGPEKIAVRLWIEPETFYLRRMSMAEAAAPDEEPTVWLVDLWDFGQVVEIQTPEIP